jgi:hypothetical protein
MSTAGFSKVRLGRLHQVMAGYVERGEVPVSSQYLAGTTRYMPT